jgi:alcohol dehydrogenase
MKAVTYTEHGGADRLHLAEWPMPEPAPGEVRVRIRAVALNGFDPMILQKTTGIRNPMPMIPCGDGAGEIDAIGADVTDWKVGDRVSIEPGGDFGMMGESALGLAREFAVVPASNLYALPAGVGFVQAAALPVAYGTAWRMLSVRGALRDGETMLVLGAAGGVGIACLQIAQIVGARTIAVARGRARCERLEQLGADHVVDGGTDWVEAVRAIAGRPRYGGTGGGVDVVVNYVGGETYPAAQKVLRLGGRMLVCGASAGHVCPVDARYLWSFEQSLIGSDGWTAEDQHALLALVAEGRLDPVIDGIHGFADAPAAMARMLDRAAVGKVVMTPDGAPA